MQTVDIAQRQAVGGGPLKLIRRHPLISYFAIAYAFSWTYDLLFLVRFPLPDVPGRSTPRDFGPSVAALVVTAVIAGKPGLKQFFQRFLIWRVNAVWYLFIFVAVPAIYLLGILLVPGALASFKAPPLIGVLLSPLIFLILVVLAGPLFEEPGWRGFALPRLQQRWDPLVGALILGVLWAGWHATEYLTPDFARANGGLTLSGVSVFLVGAVCFSIIITWVFNHTRASIFMAILLHGSINFSQFALVGIFPAAAWNEVGPVATFVLATLVIVLATRGRLGYRPAAATDRGGPDAV